MHRTQSHHRIAFAAAAALAGMAGVSYAGESTNTVAPTRHGTVVPGAPAATISFSGQVALRNFTTGLGITALQPGTSVTFYYGPTNTPVTYYAPADGSTYVQLAKKNFLTPDTNIGGSSSSTVNTYQEHSALRVEWHEQGSVQGVTDLVNDQIGYTTGPGGTGIISNTASRGPSAGNPTWVNGNRFDGTVSSISGHALNANNYANTYDSAVYNLATGQNIAGGQNRIQYAQGEYKTENFAKAGPSSPVALPGQAGFGRGNPVLLPAATPTGLGNRGGRQSFQPESVANQSTNKVDPESTTGATYAEGPWNTAGANNIDSKQFAVTAVAYAANPGTGIKQIQGEDAKWLQATGRLSNGANFNVVSRANDAGQRTVPAVNVGLDPSWAVGENDDGNTSGTANQNAQKSIGAGIRFSGKTSGTDARAAIAQSRLGIGALSIAEVRDAASNAPIRALDVDFVNAHDTGNLSDHKRITFDNINNFTYKAVLISHINTVKAANVPLLNAYRNDFQNTNGRAPTAAEEQTWWNNLSSDETGIKGDPSGNVKSFINNITGSIGTAASGITVESVNNPADALFLAGYTIPGLLNFKREVDGGPLTPNNLNAQQLAVQANIRDNYGARFTADGSGGSNNQTIGTGAFYTALNAPGLTLNAGGTAALAITAKDASGNAVGNTVEAPKGNYLFGNFNQDGRRDFASVKESVNAALSLRAVDGALNSIYLADGGVANNTVVSSLSGTPGWTSTANTKGDLVILGDFNTDGRFDGRDVDLLARGASLSDNAGTDHLTIASGATFSQQVRNANARLNKNAALDYVAAATSNLGDAGQTFLRKSAQTALQAANDPTGVNAFNKFDINRDGLINRQDAAIVDSFVGRDYRVLADQLSAVVATNINEAGTVFIGDPTIDQSTARRQISLVDVELNDNGAITHVAAGGTSDFKLIREALGSSLLDGDTNFTGGVDVTDLSTLLNNYNSAGKWSSGDFDFDGFVDVTDLSSLLNNYNTLASAASLTIDLRDYSLDGLAIAALSAEGFTLVPEPGIGLLAAMGLVMAGRRRRIV